MNLLFITDGITPYVTGGMQKHSHVLVKLLLQSKIRVTLVHCGYTGQATFSENTMDLFSDDEQKFLTVEFIPFLFKGKIPGHYIHENKVYSTAVYEKFKSQINQFDFIYTQGFTGWAFVGKSIKPKVLVNFHGFEMFQKAPNLKVKLEYQLLKPFVRKICKKADYVYSFGGKIDAIIQKMGIPSHKILDQSNGIESKWLIDSPLQHDRIGFIFIGRNERRKGIIELTNALIEIKNKGLFNFDFTFVGPIAPHPELNIPEVTYVGEVKDQNKIHDLLRENDILVCPSHSEGMPTVILEAMANGLAIITTNVGASSKMINDNGFVLANSSPEAIKEAILMFTNQKDSELNAMKNSSLQLVQENFVWEKIAERKINDLLEILE